MKKLIGVLKKKIELNTFIKYNLASLTLNRYIILIYIFTKIFLQFSLTYIKSVYKKNYNFKCVFTKVILFLKLYQIKMYKNLLKNKKNKFMRFLDLYSKLFVVNR